MEITPPDPQPKFMLGILRGVVGDLAIAAVLKKLLSRLSVILGSRPLALVLPSSSCSLSSPSMSPSPRSSSWTWPWSLPCVLLPACVPVA